MTEIETPEPTPKKSRKVLWIAVAVIVVAALLAGGFFGARQYVANQFLAGLIAYDQRNAKEAVEIFRSITSFPAFISPEIIQANEKVAEIETYQASLALWDAGDYPQALESYRSFYITYPYSSFAGASHEAIQEIAFQWAQSLTEPTDALEIYELVLEDSVFSDASKDRATPLMSPLYLTRGEGYLDEEEYELAVSDLLNAYNFSEESDLQKSAEKLIRKGYQALLETAQAEKDYEAQVAILQGWFDFLEQGHLSGLDTVEMQLADAYLAWGKSLFAEEEYEDAIAAFESALEYGGDTIRATLEENLGLVYVTWGNQMLGSGQETAAMQKYILLINDYSHTEAVDAINPQIAASLVAYADDKLEAGESAEAVKVYKAVVRLSDQITDKDLLAQANYGLARASFLEESYLDAVKGYLTAAALTEDAALIEKIETANAEALTMLGAVEDAFGLLIVEAVKAAFVQGEDAMIFPFCQVFESEELCISKEDFQAARLSVGTNPTEKMTAVDGGEYRNEMLATSPGRLHYIIKFERETIFIRTCDYVTIRRIRLKLDLLRAKVTVSVYNAATGEMIDRREFLGENPFYCPTFYAFNQWHDKFIGGDPPADTVNAWLDSIIQ